MTSAKRPLSVTILCCLYILVGAAGFAAHFRELLHHQRDALLVECVELVAIISGAFMLRGQNWARWIALAWIAFHVALSAFHPWTELAAHSAFCAIIAWILFRAEGSRYFRGTGSEVT